MVKTAKKRRKKDEENNADPQFFLNRLVPIFPELRDEMNEERIVYGQVRPAIFAKEKVAPKCEQLALQYKDSEPMKRLCTVLCEMYAAGDMDTRAVDPVRRAQQHQRQRDRQHHRGLYRRLRPAEGLQALEKADRQEDQAREKEEAEEG